MALRLIKSVYATDLQKILRKLLFDILEKEDDYIQIPYMIIQKVGTSIHLLKVLMSAFLFLCYHCTSVSNVLKLLCFIYFQLQSARLSYSLRFLFLLDNCVIDVLVLPRHDQLSSYLRDKLFNFFFCTKNKVVVVVTETSLGI